MTPVQVHRGDGPVILGMPHTGTLVPDDIFARLNARGQTLSDTDWHVHALYEQVAPEVTCVRATFHRYVIDANRDPSGASLYPGQNTTGLVPLTDFDGAPIWERPPDAAEIEARRRTWHAPYHDALEAEIRRVKGIHGVAILYDCHSIRSVIAHLFAGRLADFNIGTNHGTTCAPEVERTVADICASARGYTTALNGRFAGGWTTRHHGRPHENVHAIQMELAQRSYLHDENRGWGYDAVKAQRLRTHLSQIIKSLADLAPRLKGRGHG